jgi:hypothetical protein
MALLEKRLEYYTLRHPEEVLLVKVQYEGELDEVTVFKGFSSSLMRQTAFDPDVPIIPADALVLSIDRFQSPYNPASPQVIAQDLSWEQFSTLLELDGI